MGRISPRRPRWRGTESVSAASKARHAALMAGRLFDDRGNRMSPTHANKRGVRYRYYVSHALLQNRPRASPRDRDPRV
jgi:hypothetical protein